MTLGEYRVGIDFNPTGSAQVSEIKRSAAAMIDLCAAGAGDTGDPEIGRLWLLAMAHIEDAAMWAVKAATKRAKE